MSLAIPLASKNLPTGATLPLMTHLRPPFDSKVDAHRLCRFLVLVTFFDPILKETFRNINYIIVLYIEENLFASNRTCIEYLEDITDVSPHMAVALALGHPRFYRL
jgi:hypothetical protein